MSIYTHEPTESIVLEKEENSLNNFSVERMDYLNNERNLENKIDKENDGELIEKNENITNIGQFVLDMRGGEPEDWKLTYQESGSKFDGKELFGQDGTSLTEIIRNSDLSVDKILGHEDMLNHFRDNMAEPYMLPDWIEQGADGEQIIHVTVVSMDKEGLINYETWTHQKEDEENKDKDKDKNDIVGLKIELEEVINMEEKEIIDISKTEEGNLIKNEEKIDIVLEINNSLNYNENTTLNEKNESLHDEIATNERVYSNLGVNVDNKEVSHNSEMSSFGNNEFISNINYINEENINNIINVDNKEEVVSNLQTSEVVVDKDINHINENIIETKEINNTEEKKIINQFNEKIEEVNIINNAEAQNSIQNDIKFDGTNEIKEINIEINNTEEVKVINYTETKDILEHINIVSNNEVRNSVLEDINIEKTDKADGAKEVNIEIEETNIARSFEGDALKQSTVESFPFIDNNKNEESNKSNAENVLGVVNNEKQNESKEVVLEKEILNTLNSEETFRNINNIKESINNILISNKETGEKEIDQENKVKTLEEKLLDLFKDNKINISKELNNEKQNGLQPKEVNEKINISNKIPSKEMNISNATSSDKRELKPEISVKTNNEIKEVVINKQILNETKKDKNSEYSKDAIKVNIDNEKLTKDDLARDKEVKMSGPEILMKTLGLSSRLNNEGVRVVYSNMNQYQKDEDDNKVLSSNKSAYKPLNLNGISLKIRA